MGNNSWLREARNSCHSHGNVGLDRDMDGLGAIDSAEAVLRDRMEFGRGSFHNPFRVGNCDGLIPGVVPTPGFDAESRWDS